MRVAHLTTVDMSLRYLVLPQLLDVRDRGGEAIGISSSGPFVSEIEAQDVRHVALPTSTRGMHPVADLRAAWDLWRILRREHLDVLHTHNPKPGLYGRVLGRIAGVPVVVNTVHGLYATQDDAVLKRLVVYGLETIAARFSDVELIQSREDLELLVRLSISPAFKTRLLGNGVDVARFRPEARTVDRRRELRSAMGIPEGDVVIGMVGRLVAEKGWRELFAAAGELGSGYTFLAIGPEDPEKADALTPEALQAAREDGVRLLGMRTDMVDLYGVMDVFALPSYREGFPRAAMEAASSGLPVIATDIRGCREVVEDGVNGFLVPVRDAMALAAAIERLGRDPQQRASMGTAGRRKAEAEFDERRVVDRVRQSYVDAYRRKRVDLPTGLDEKGAVTIRDAEVADARFLSSLDRFRRRIPGRWLARRFYEALIAYDGAVVLVAEDAAGPVGFAAGVDDTGRFWETAASGVLGSLGIHAAWRGTGPKRGAGRPQLLSFAVVPDRRDGDVVGRLGAMLLERMAERGHRVVHTKTHFDDPGTVADLESLGFTDRGVRGDRATGASAELTWSADVSGTEVAPER